MALVQNSIKYKNVSPAMKSRMGQALPPIVSWVAIEDTPEAPGFVRASENEAIPKAYILEHLRQMGSILFNNSFSTNVRLQIYDKQGNKDAFWVHDFYFSQESPLLFRLLNTSRPRRPSSPFAELHGWLERGKIEKDEESDKLYVQLEVPCSITFGAILEWLYVHDDDKWLSSMNEESFDGILANVAYLRLNQDAYYVLARYYENL
ncbi:hypothetical protein K493DRAFT_319904 [Basidiobolus meristosporus CBS 931.73]|uniref:BTB domain-containing protein n=1 Tax=Basidiobolus meristosporus CBS 931.73 TaxID=1314790 RepID=A0A1Y1XJ27_9FUNG|nr:hypothetical protein K493DRAFT_319904 [Basidiobolus meristosporus CBS 931.73]|eukprot:ORX85755.1 hypothetical protein K493DRAFT_319904 [Basidiobolus meristosporus CBS 931.73]